MEKKKYVSPMTEVVLVEVGAHLLEASPIHTGGPDKPSGSRSTSPWDSGNDE